MVERVQAARMAATQVVAAIPSWEVCKTLASTAGPAIKGIANGTRNGSLEFVCSDLLLMAGKIICRAMMNKIIPPDILREDELICSELSIWSPAK